MIGRMLKLRREKVEAEQVLFELGDNPDPDDPEVADANATINEYMRLVNKFALGALALTVLASAVIVTSSSQDSIEVDQKPKVAQKMEPIVEPDVRQNSNAIDISLPENGNYRLTPTIKGNDLLDDVAVHRRIWVKLMKESISKSSTNSKLALELVEQLENEEVTEIRVGSKESPLSRWYERHSIPFYSYPNTFIAPPINYGESINYELRSLAAPMIWVAIANIVDYNNGNKTIPGKEVAELMILGQGWMKDSVKLLEKLPTVTDLNTEDPKIRKEEIRRLIIKVVRSSLLKHGYDAHDASTLEAATYILTKYVSLRADIYADIFGEDMRHFRSMAYSPVNIKL